MATEEQASASHGPRYAPDDPTLPAPWKGLIDGSILYYWNPETNVTQYEKPASLPPPLPPGQPPSASTPKLSPIPVPHSVTPSSNFPQHGQQMAQVPQQQGHQMTQQPNPEMGQTMQQHGQGQPFGQMVQHLNAHQMQQHMIQQMQPHQSGQPQQGLQQNIHQMPQQLGQQTPQTQGSQMAPPQGQQLTPQQMQYMNYQQSMPTQRQHNLQQYNQPGAQVQPFPNQQEFKPSFPRKEEEDFHGRNHVGFSPSQFHQVGGSAGQNQSVGANSTQLPHVGNQSVQPQQFGGSLHMQQPASMGQLRPAGNDLANNLHGSRFQNERDAPIMQGQQSNMPPGGLIPGHENNFYGRGGNDFTYSRNQEAPNSGPQPKLAAIPAPRNQQGMGLAPYPNAAPVHGSAPNNGAGHVMHSMYSQGTGRPPFSNNAMVKPPYHGSTDVSGLSPAEIYCRQHEVNATGDDIPAPFMTFEATGFPPEILREIYSAGFSSPTPIQAQTWPVALQSKDIVAIAKTGSGKTLGYLIPAFVHLRQRRNNPQNGPTVLVLAPTRELATQIQDEAIKFGRSSRVSCTCLYGGAPKGPQLKELDNGADIVVATPGRLNDILEMKKIDFRQISLLVLDEADRMLDMGFEPQIRTIVNEIPSRRQTLMYTATWPKEVRKIAGDLLVNPVQVNIGNVDELSANKAITQYVEVVPPMEKQRRLEQILRSQERGSKVIIFCSTKRLCDQLARGIGRSFGAAAIHGDKSQAERDWVLNQFRSGKSPVLVATDVAARGLDIKDIRAVINYDFPTGIEDYVHRIGRTGRAGATGVSYTFFSEQDWKYAADLIKLLEGANQCVPQEVRDIAMRGGPGFGKDRRFDSSGGGRGGFGGRGGRVGMRDGNFGGRGGPRDGNFGGMRDNGGFGGHGGPRDGAMGGYGGRGDFFGGRGNRGRGFSGPEPGFGRNDRMQNDHYNNMDGGRGRGRGRGRFDNRRDVARNRDTSYSRSPERVRTWGYSRSKSRSRSRSRSWSRSRSRSWSRSPSRSRSRSRGRNRSYSRSPRRNSRKRSNERNGSPREQILDQKDSPPRIPDLDATLKSEASPVASDTRGSSFQEAEAAGKMPADENTNSGIPDVDQSSDLPVTEV